MKKYSLSADERIKSRKDFKLLFSKGKLIFSQTSKLKALYFIEQNSETPGIKIAPVVFKKAGPAPWRNRIRRLIKEVYRLNKFLLLDKAIESQSNLKILFFCNLLNFKNCRKVSFKDVYPDMFELINKISIDL